MGLCPLPLYLDGHKFLLMAEVIPCPKLRHGRNLASVFLAEILAFEALRLRVRNVRHWGPHNRRKPWQGHGWNPLKMPRDPADQSQLLWCPAVSATATSIWLQLCERVWARPNHLGPSQIPHRDKEIIKWELRVLLLTVENITYGVLVTIFKKKSSSYYHLWNNQPLPCSFNSEALLNNLSVFWSLSRHSPLAFHFSTSIQMWPPIPTP